MKRQESSEDYLETILILKNKLGEVRSIDIVNELGFSKPSVSVAMKNLRQKGMIEVDGDGHITLTDTGSRLAESVYERHILLTNALMLLGVCEETAKADACRIEHDMSKETFEKIKDYVNRVNGNLSR